MIKRKYSIQSDIYKVNVTTTVEKCKEHFTYIIRHGNFWWVKFRVVGPAARLVDQPSDNTINQQIVIDGKFHNRLQLPLAFSKKLIKLKCRDNKFIRKQTLTPTFPSESTSTKYENFYNVVT